MDIRKTMEGLVDGISGRKRKEMGPLGQAVELLIGVIKEAQKKGVESPTLKAAHVVMDNAAITREALDRAAKALNFVTALLVSKEPPTGKDLNQLGMLIGDFEDQATKARLHQYVPFQHLPKFHDKFDLPRPS
jgi:hypothetical protein